MPPCYATVAQNWAANAEVHPPLVCSHSPEYYAYLPPASSQVRLPPRIWAGNHVPSGSQPNPAWRDSHQPQDMVSPTSHNVFHAFSTALINPETPPRCRRNGRSFIVADYFGQNTPVPVVSAYGSAVLAQPPWIPELHVLILASNVWLRCGPERWRVQGCVHLAVDG